MTNEEILSDFIRKNYTDERLAWTLVHAQTGRLSIHSCCCFIGIPTADHALRGAASGMADIGDHLVIARELPGAYQAEDAYMNLGRAEFFAAWPQASRDGISPADLHDQIRREKLIPILEAEILRRESLRAQVEASELVTV